MMPLIIDEKKQNLPLPPEAKQALDRANRLRDKRLLSEKDLKVPVRDTCPNGFCGSFVGLQKSGDIICACNAGKGGLGTVRKAKVSQCTAQPHGPVDIDETAPRQPPG